MDTQFTPVHIRLWNKDFWLLMSAELLISVSVCMLLPTMPRWLFSVEEMNSAETGIVMGAFGLGLFALGCLCSWLVQHYRRNMVCIWAIVALILDVAVLWYFDSLHTRFAGCWLVAAQRFLLGAFFGLAQMVLMSTLIIDTCESEKRTEANYSASWFARFALSLGPLAGLQVYDAFGFGMVLLTSMGCAAVAVLLIRYVSFPFRAPEESISVVSLDRFFLPHGMVLFVNLILVSCVIGLLLSMQLSAGFYALMMGGFLLAVLAQRFVFREAELKSEVVAGLILLLAAQLIIYNYPQSPVAPVLIGLGVGLVGSRFLLFFIKLSRHCKRGTSQSTCFLGWEAGLALGIALGYALYDGEADGMLRLSVTLTVLSLAFYHFFVHGWFMRNKNR